MQHQREITSEMCGRGKNVKGHKQRACRLNLLERLRLRSPKLPPQLEDSWPRFVWSWSTFAAEKYGPKIGHTFVTEINDVLEKLKCYYNGRTPYNKGSRVEGQFLVWDKVVGDQHVFENYVKACWQKLPKSTVAVCI